MKQLITCFSLILMEIFQIPSMQLIIHAPMNQYMKGKALINNFMFRFNMFENP